MKHLSAAVLLFSTIYLLACATETSSQQPINPNGDSELALLMRSMFEDGLKIKEQIAKGKQPAFSVDYEKIHSAEATDGIHINSAHFDAFADSYLQAVKALKAAKPDETKAMYNGMISSCMGCHQTFCPGPTVRIKKLYL